MQRTRLIRSIWMALLASAFGVAGTEAQETRYLDVVYDVDDVQVTNDVEYGGAWNSRGEWETLLLDVYEPVDDPEPRRPAIVWVHGGFFRVGDKTGYQSTIEQFTTAGWVVFSINYRLRPEIPNGAAGILTELRLHEAVDATIDAQHDAQAAIRWVRRHADDLRIDPDRVGIVGHSAGGIIAIQVAMNTHDPGTSGNPGWSSRPTVAVAMAGGGISGVTYWADPGEPPLQIVHGLADETVPYVTAAPVCLETLANGNVCEQVLDPDQDHGTFGHAEIREFLYRWLVDRPPLLLPTNLTIVP